MKKKYNKWLFKKYGKTGVPKILRWIPLYSPTLFYQYVYESIPKRTREELDRFMESEVCGHGTVSQS